jgi:hypothetical protein
MKRSPASGAKSSLSFNLAVVRHFYFLLFLFLLAHLHTFAQRRDFSLINFNKADSIAFVYKGHSLLDLKNLSHKLTDNLTTDVEKFRAIYRWVCENIDYDYNAFRKNQAQRQKLKTPEELKAWNQKIRVEVYKNLIEDKKTVCTGYAYLVKELSNHSNIPCEILDGYGRNAVSNVRGPAIANHQWNAVRLNNKWYLADATWSSGAYHLPERAFKRKYDDNYFLADHALFVRNHYPLDTAWLLLGDKPTLDRFLSRPLVYSPLYKYGIHKFYPDSFDIKASRSRPFVISFLKAGDAEVKIAKLRIESGGKAEDVIVPLEDDGEGFFNMRHQFRSKGRRVVHGVLDEEVVFSVNVEVE